MRSIVVATLLLAVAAHPPRNMWMKFQSWQKDFGRDYASSLVEKQRFEIFKTNVARIDEVNARNLTYRLGMTPFSDLTFDEFRDQYLTGFVPSTSALKSSRVFHAPQGFSDPDSVDWVAKGGVSSVKNQAQCGSCWTFSATGALEGAMHIAGRKLVDLSQQMILDCDTGGNKCQGGSMDQAFGWVQQNGLAADSEDSYKCASSTSASCTGSTCPKNVTKVLAPGDVTGKTDVGQTEGALEAAVAQQPVSVAIEADKDAFQHYTSGVLTSDACGTNLDHGVLVVGYGADNGQKYWKVKNSWGTTFGEQGYIRLAKGTATEGGECGIRKMASFPTVKSSGAVVVV